MLELILLVWWVDHTAAVMLSILSILTGWYYLNCRLAAWLDSCSWSTPQGGQWIVGFGLSLLTGTILFFLGLLSRLLITQIPFWYEYIEQLLRHYGLE